MAVKIIDECIACDACVEACPSGAITCDDPIYIVTPALCTECVGYLDDPKPSCIAVCPVDAIVYDEAHQESFETLLEKYKRNIRNG
jgi:ferredoxin